MKEVIAGAILIAVIVVLAIALHRASVNLHKLHYIIDEKDAKSESDKAFIKAMREAKANVKKDVEAIHSGSGRASFDATMHLLHGYAKRGHKE